MYIQRKDVSSIKPPKPALATCLGLLIEMMVIRSLETHNTRLSSWFMLLYLKMFREFVGFSYGEEVITYSG